MSRGAKFRYWWRLRFVIATSPVIDYPRIHWSYATPGGGPVLRDHSPWYHDINGIGISAFDRHYWIEFRRFA